MRQVLSWWIFWFDLLICFIVKPSRNDRFRILGESQVKDPEPLSDEDIFFTDDIETHVGGKAAVATTIMPEEADTKLSGSFIRVHRIGRKCMHEGCSQLTFYLTIAFEF